MSKRQKSIGNIGFLGKTALVLLAGYSFFRSLLTLLGFRQNVCPYYPTCSAYAKIAFSTVPFHRALFLSGKRFLSCHPWREPSIDIPPEQ